MGGYNDQQQIGAAYIPPQQAQTGGVSFEAAPNPALAMVAPPVEQGVSWGKGMTFAGMEPVQQKSGASASSSGGGFADGAEALGKGINKFFKKRKKKGELDAFEQKYGEGADPADPGPEPAEPAGE